MAARSWIGTSGDAWQNTADWSPSIVPTSADDVTIAGPTGSTYQVVSGPGTSASLALSGNTTLSGLFNIGALGIGTAATAGALNIGSGSVVTTSAAAILYGSILVNGAGAKLTDAGALTLGGGTASFNYVADNLTVSGGATVQTGNVSMLANNGGETISVDGASTYEIGTAGGAAAGQLTIDAGQTLSGAGTVTTVNGIVNNGTITAQGALTIGSVSGAGQLQIAAGASLSVSGTEAITFLGATGTLNISAGGFSGGLSEGTISGFVQGDTIDLTSFGYGLTSVTYTPGSAGLGTMTLRSNTTVLGTLSLAGNYAGYTFQISPTNNPYGFNITLAIPAAGGGTPSAGTTTPDVYRWSATGSGTWNDATKWTDVTAATAPAAIAPGANDTVTLAGPTDGTYQVVTGPGNSAGLTLIGNTTLNGAFNTGALVVGTAANAGALNLESGSVIDAGSATLFYGPILVNGTGAVLTVTGALTVGGNTSQSSFTGIKLTVAGGGVVQAGNLVMLTSAFGSTISIDGASTIEIGTAGGATSGTLTIDTGRTFFGSGTVTTVNGITNNGTITAESSLYLGNVSGAGQLQIAGGASLTVSGTEAIAFLANTGTLDVGVGFSGGLSEGTISGFVQGDTIAVTSYNAGLTSATYTAGNAGLGTLTLRSNTTVLGTLSLAGNYAGYVFQVSPSTSAYLYNIALAIPSSGGGPASPGTTTPDAYDWLTAGSGSWNDATRWTDITSGANPATIAPGVNNTVTLAGPTDTTYQVVTGPANSASLTLTGNTTLSGAFNVGALNVGSLSSAGGLNIGTGSVVTASSATILYGPVSVSGTGAALTATGALTLGGATSNANYAGNKLTVSGGGTVQANGLSLVANTGGNTISIDGTSSVEVGTTGGAAIGKLTVDAGQTVAASGTVSAYYGTVNNGVITAQGPLTLGIVSGTGQLQIGAGASLTVSGTEATTFLGNTGTLNLGVAAGSGLSEGTISGFVQGDTIALTDYSGSLTAVTYTASSAGLGTLTLRSNTTVLGTLALAGNYATSKFLVSPSTTLNNFNITLAAAAAPPANSFAGTGNSDLLLQHDDGTIVIESQANLAITGAALVGNPGATWHIVGSADYNGDGHADLLLQNNNGGIVDYLMNGTTIASGNYLGNAGPSWHVRGSADFNHDGNSDILLQNDNGAVVIWTSNGAAVTGAAYVGNPGAGWTVEGVADFNGDGQPDILLQNSNGAIVVYAMNGTTIASGAYLGNPGSGWSVAGTGDYNNDGKADLLLHNDNGADVIWETNGAAVTGAAYIGNPGPSYTGTVAGVDLNGDGSPDLVIQRTDSTLVGYTFNNNAVITAGALLGTPGAGWHAIGNDPIQFIDGTGSALNLTATPGADQFDLTTFAGGLHQIASFDPAQDSVALSGATYTNYAGVQAHEFAYQGGTFIALTPGTTGAAVVILGVTPDHLSAANFVLR